MKSRSGGKGHWAGPHELVVLGGLLGPCGWKNRSRSDSLQMTGTRYWSWSQMCNLGWGQMDGIRAKLLWRVDNRCTAREGKPEL